MVKKFSFLLISAAVVVAGYIAFTKLNYWERSIRIFSFDNQTERFGGRRPGGDFRSGERVQFRDPGRRERPSVGEIPDSLRRRFESRGSRPDFRTRDLPDSLMRQRFQRNEAGTAGGPAFEGRRGTDGRHGRGDFRGGKKINLTNIIWFLAVFASFTAVTIYFDKLVCILSKKIKGNGHSSLL